MEKKRKILIANDDGIESENLALLARLAKELGEVWVVAPAAQCSGMSQRITFGIRMELAKIHDYPVEGVHAYSLEGTPVDCVRAALHAVMPEKPDVVFSGINKGYNVGFDIMYSGTAGAAVEAAIEGIPAIAFSADLSTDPAVLEQKIPPITRDLLGRELKYGEVWNVNFPPAGFEELKGILDNRFPSASSYYKVGYEADWQPDGSAYLSCLDERGAEPEEGSDMYAILHGYISIGKIRAGVL